MGVFDRLRGPDVLVEPAVGVVAGLRREVATSSVGRPHLRSVANLSFEALASGRDLMSTLALLRAAISLALMLLPDAEDEVVEAMKLFLVSPRAFR